MAQVKPARCAECGGSFNPARGACPRCRKSVERARAAKQRLSDDELANHKTDARRFRLGARAGYALGSVLLLVALWQFFFAPSGAMPLPAGAILGFVFGGMALLKAHLLAAKADAAEELLA
jgi:hypothetical protein